MNSELSKNLESNINNFENMDLDDSYFSKDTIEHDSSPLPLYISIDDNGFYYFKEKHFNYTEKVKEEEKEKEKEKEKEYLLKISQDSLNDSTKKKTALKLTTRNKHKQKKISNSFNFNSNQCYNLTMYYNPLVNENENVIKSVSLIQQKYLPFLIKKTKNKYSNYKLVEIKEETLK